MVGRSAFEHDCEVCASLFGRMREYAGAGKSRPIPGFHGQSCEKCGAMLMWGYLDRTYPSAEAELLLDTTADLPDHAPTFDTMLTLTNEWAIRYWRLRTWKSDRLFSEWPLPVGVQSMHAWMTGTNGEGRELDSEDAPDDPGARPGLQHSDTEHDRFAVGPEDLPDPVPGVPDTAMVGLAVVRGGAWGEVTLLGLVESADEEADVWHFIDAVVILPPYKGGIPPAATDPARKCAKKMTDWYRRFVIGTRMPTGRPEGSKLLDAALAVWEQALASAKQHSRGKRVTPGQMARELQLLGVSVADYTVGEWVRDGKAPPLE